MKLQKEVVIVAVLSLVKIFHIEVINGTDSTLIYIRLLTYRYLLFLKPFKGGLFGLFIIRLAHDAFVLVFIGNCGAWLRITVFPMCFVYNDNVRQSFLDLFFWLWFTSEDFCIVVFNLFLTRILFLTLARYIWQATSLLVRFIAGIGETIVLNWDDRPTVRIVVDFIAFVCFMILLKW